MANIEIDLGKYWHLVSIEILTPNESQNQDNKTLKIQFYRIYIKINMLNFNINEQV